MTNQRYPLCQLTNQGPGQCQHPDTTEAALMTDMRTGGWLLSPVISTLVSSEQLWTVDSD